MVQAPINPSDINTIEGKYPLAPKLPGGIPGHEGVGEVLEVGAQVQDRGLGAPCKVVM
jgi:trans-2-enoyl-CoA reductase